jgi:hypothetical protein
MDAVDEKIANIGSTVNEAIDSKMMPIKNLIRDTIEEEIPRLYNWAIIRVICSFAIIGGLILTIITNQQAMEFIFKYGVIIGLVVIIIGSGLLILRSRPKKTKQNK